MPRKAKDENVSEVQENISKAQNVDSVENVKDSTSDTASILDYIKKLEEEIKTLKEKSSEVSKQKSKVVSFKSIPRDEIFTIKNNTKHAVVYQADDSSCYFELNDYGDFDYISYKDLAKLKNTHRKFFTKNLIVVESNENYKDEDVYKSLGVETHYKYLITEEDMEKLLAMKPASIIDKISLLNDGMKNTVKEFVIEKYETKELDSLSRIEAFEKALNINLKELV